MKKILFSLMLTMFTVSAYGATVNYQATWDANTESDLAGYKLYINNNNVIDVGNVTSYDGSIEVPDNAVTDIKFELTAYDVSNNESERSDSVTLTVDFEPPSKPTGLVAKIIEIIVSFFKAVIHFFA